MKNSLLLIVFLFTLFSSSLSAQSMPTEAEMKVFAQKYEKAYNQQDVEALKAMYLDDAVHVAADGKEVKGADQIAALLKDRFIKDKVTLTVNQKSVHWSDFHYAGTAKGTYKLKGATIVYDIEINEEGTYENVMIKKDGEWKIAKAFISTND